MGRKWTEDEKARWWDEYHRRHREMVIVPAPLHTEVEVDPDLIAELGDDAFGEVPVWGPKKGAA